VSAIKKWMCKFRTPHPVSAPFRARYKSGRRSASRHVPVVSTVQKAISVVSRCDQHLGTSMLTVG
jgi:hypothetical protein